MQIDPSICKDYDIGGMASARARGCAPVRPVIRRYCGCEVGEIRRSRLRRLPFRPRPAGRRLVEGLRAAGLDVLLSRHADPSVVLNALPNANNTPELQLKCAEDEPFALLDQIKANARFEGAREVNRIDDVRAEYADGFVIPRRWW